MNDYEGKILYPYFKIFLISEIKIERYGLERSTSAGLIFRSGLLSLEDFYKLFNVC